MSTAPLPAPMAEGDLARTPFAHVLLHVHARALTGSLVVWDPSAEEGRQQDRVRFEHGRPTAGRLRERASRLDRGMLPLFARTDGPYAFYEGVDLVGQGEHVRTGSVDVVPLIAASLRGSSRDDVVRHVVAGLGDAKLRLVRGADVDALGLLPEEVAFVDLLRAEPAPAAALSQISPLDDRVVARLIYLLTITKCVEPWDGVVTPSKRPTPSARPTPPSGARPRESAPPKNGPEPPPPPPERLSERHRELWDDIGKRATEIERENYFEMLGVPRDAPASKIQSAYYGHVKKWHPDRIPPELIELRPFVERIFQYLTRAQETLCDDEKRGPYLATVQEGGGTPEAERELGNIVQAAMDFRKVEVLMRRRDFEGALRILDEIMAISPDEADYYATRAEILHQMGAGSGSDRATVLADLDTALRLAEGHDKAHYLKGVVLKQAGQAQKALEHFRRAAELNPKNIAAVREVRIAQMRGSAPPDKGEPASGDSFFGKLFKGKKKKD